MSESEYSFVGLDEWEKKLAKVIERDYPEEFQKMVIGIAAEVEGRTKEKTPVKTGLLQNTWRIGEIVKKGNEYVIEVFNNTEYAENVEYGHRTRGGGFKKGAHMFELSLKEVQDRLPDYLRNWMNDFINTHEFM